MFLPTGAHPCPTLIKEELNTEKEYRGCAQLSQLTSEQLSGFLMDSFLLHYKNKAPMIIHINTRWLVTNAELISSSLTDFVRRLEALKKRDVYFLAISSILDWIESPSSLKASASHWLWSCDDSDTAANVDNCLSFQERTEKLKDKRNKEQIAVKKKVDVDLTRSESLFPSHVINYVIVLFTVLAILTILYDQFVGSSDSLKRDKNASNLSLFINISQN